MEYTILLLGVLIFAAKLLSVFFKKIGFPPVLAPIVLGLLVGPSGLNIAQLLHYNIEFLQPFVDIGVIILLFEAGLETDIKQMQQVGKNAFWIAFVGFAVPWIIGAAITYGFYQNIPTSIFTGVASSATSISVSVMVLMQLNRLKSVEGATILGAAILDDVFGILGVVVTMSIFGASSTSVAVSISMIIGYFILSYLIGMFVVPITFDWVYKFSLDKIFLSAVFFFMLVFAWVAEEVGLAAMTGAYIIGLFIGRTRYKHEIDTDVKTVGQSLFIPMFFLSIGLEANLRVGNINWLYPIIYAIGAIFTKLITIYFIAKLLGFNKERSAMIGIGMIPRGEVALIVGTIALGIGEQIGFRQEDFIAVVLMSIVTIFVTPFLFEIVDRFEKNKLKKV